MSKLIVIPTKSVDFLNEYCRFKKISIIDPTAMLFAPNQSKKTVEIFFCKNYVKLQDRNDPSKKIQLTYGKNYSYEEIEFRLKKLN